MLIRRLQGIQKSFYGIQAREKYRPGQQNQHLKWNIWKNYIFFSKFMINYEIYANLC